MTSRVRSVLVTSLSAALLAGLAACSAAPPPQADPPLDADPPTSDVPPGSAKANPALDRGVAFVKAGKLAEAVPHLEEALATDPDRADAAFYLAVCREDAKQPAEAEKLYKQALAKDPALVEAAMNLAALYLGEPPRPAEAIAVLDQALKKAPGDPKLLANLGYAHGLAGDVPAASKAYEAALAKEDSAELRFAYGVMLFDAKQAEAAVPQLRKAADKITDVPTLATIARMMGHGKAFDDCVKILDGVIAKKKDAAELYVRRGVCKHELKDEKGAAEDYQKAIGVDPGFAAAHYYYGLSMLAQGNKLKARSSLRKASELGKDGPIGKQARDKIKENKW